MVTVQVSVLADGVISTFASELSELSLEHATKSIMLQTIIPILYIRFLTSIFANSDCLSVYITANSKNLA